MSRVVVAVCSLFISRSYYYLVLKSLKGWWCFLIYMLQVPTMRGSVVLCPLGRYRRCVKCLVSLTQSRQVFITVLVLCVGFRTGCVCAELGIKSALLYYLPWVEYSHFLNDIKNRNPG